MDWLGPRIPWETTILMHTRCAHIIVKSTANKTSGSRLVPGPRSKSGLSDSSALSRQGTGDRALGTPLLPPLLCTGNAFDFSLSRTPTHDSLPPPLIMISVTHPLLACPCFLLPPAFACLYV